MPHIPVLLQEVIHNLNPQEGKKYLDCTFGAGGYTKALLTTGAFVDSIDRDETVAQFANKLQSEFQDKFKFHKMEFADIAHSFPKSHFDGIVFDIGVSSMQIDQKERGFSFQADAALDMRMDSQSPLTAEHVINNYEYYDLKHLIRELGGEKKAGIIAKAIIEHREKKEIKTTLELANLIKNVVKHYNDSIHPATRTFQAIRMIVNDEINQLKLGLQAAKSLLKLNGVLSVVTFHSGEDKIVKNFFDLLCGKKIGQSRYLPTILESESVTEFEYVHKGIVIASEKEVAENPRSRSAKLRSIRKVIDE